MSTQTPSVGPAGPRSRAAALDRAGCGSAVQSQWAEEAGIQGLASDLFSSNRQRTLPESPPRAPRVRPARARAGESTRGFSGRTERGVPRLGSSEAPPPPSPPSPPPAATCWAGAAAAVISPAQPPVTGTFLSTLELLQETTPSASHDSASPAHTTPARLGDPGHRGAAGAGGGGRPSIL